MSGKNSDKTPIGHQKIETQFVFSQKNQVFLKPQTEDDKVFRSWKDYWLPVPFQWNKKTSMYYNQSSNNRK